MDGADASLLQRAVKGDSDALESLLKQHGPGVRQTLGGQIPRRWQSLLSADDVLQQTYADAFRDVRQFVPRGAGSFEAWLRTAARRNLLDAVKMLEADKRGGKRRQAKAPAGEESFVALYELLESDSTTPSGRAARKEACDFLGQAIDKLPETYRQVVRRYDLEGRSVREVADELGRSCGAVFMLRARAHARLREEMGTASDFLSGSA